MYTYPFTTDPSNSITPRIIDCRSIIVVEEGTDFLEIPCAAQAKPIPTYRLVTHQILKFPIINQLDLNVRT